MTNSDELREEVLGLLRVLQYGSDTFGKISTTVLESTADSIMNYIQAHQNQLIDRLIEGLPKKREKVQDIDGDPDEGGEPFCATCGQYTNGETHPEQCYCDNFNQALDQVKNLLIKEREKL